MKYKHNKEIMKSKCNESMIHTMADKNAFLKITIYPNAPTAGVVWIVFPPPPTRTRSMADNIKHKTSDLAFCERIFFIYIYI